MERKWKYYIVLNNDREDLIEETENEDPVNGLPLCQDYTIAKCFDSPEELLEWVEDKTSLSIENEDFHIEGHYETIKHDN
jgi:hypothetical protein